MSHNSRERRHSRKSTIKEERKTKENNIYNWLVAYFSEHSHCTTRRSLTTSLIRAIPTDVWSPSDISQYNSKICHGTGVIYDVTASDLAAVSPGNILCKYTDDTYIIIPAQNVDIRTTELLNIEAWSRENNLTLSTTKSVEIAVHGQVPEMPVQTAASCLRCWPIEFNQSSRCLQLTSKLSVSDHIHNIIKDCDQYCTPCVSYVLMELIRLQCKQVIIPSL